MRFLSAKPILLACLVSCASETASVPVQVPKPGTRGPIEARAQEICDGPNQYISPDRDYLSVPPSRVTWHVPSAYASAAREATESWYRAITDSGSDGKVPDVGDRKADVYLVACEERPPTVRGDLLASAVFLRKKGDPPTAPGEPEYVIRVFIPSDDRGLPTVLAHELGHLYGLAHSAIETDLMYATYRHPQDPTWMDVESMLRQLGMNIYEQYGLEQ